MPQAKGEDSEAEVQLSPEPKCLTKRRPCGSSAITSNMPGTIPNPCGRTYWEMGLTMDPNKAVPFCKRKIKAREVNIQERPQELVQKPYVLNDPEAEASLPEKKGNTLSRDLIAWVRYTVKNHEEE